MIIFKSKITGEFFNYDYSTGWWYLSKDLVAGEENIYEFINEIMFDLSLSDEDIEVIETED